MTQHSKTTDSGLVRIGNGVGPLGRWFRLVIGLNAALYLSLSPFLINPMSRDEMFTYFGELGAWLALIVVAYHVVFYFFGRFFFVRLSPWAGTAIFLGIPTLLRILGWVPMEFQIAFGLYVGISLIATFFIRYGGCEVVALPMILFKRRYTMYCPYNAVDAIERAVTFDQFTAPHKFLAVVSMAITVFVGGYKIVIDMHAFLGRWGLGFSLPPEIAWTLVIPVLYLLFMTFSAFRKTRRLLSPEVRKFGLGVVILGALTLTWLYQPLSDFPLWRSILLLGSIYFGYELVLFLFRKRKFKTANLGRR